MPCKNITRYTYETTAFQGYRLAICKNKRLFTRYFSDSQYGGAEAALQEAMRVRDNIFKLLEQGNLTVSQVFAKYTVRFPGASPPRTAGKKWPTANGHPSPQNKRPKCAVDSPLVRFTAPPPENICGTDTCRKMMETEGKAFPAVIFRRKSGNIPCPAGTK